MIEPTVIHWFRQDLRLSDNPALSHAAAQGRVLPIYILDDNTAKEHVMGGASRFWLHHSLHALNRALQGKLAVYAGNPEQILLTLIRKHPVQAVFWNRCYEPWRINRDSNIKTMLKAQGITAQSFNGSLLWEPWDIHKTDGTYYKIFTPFYRTSCLKAALPRVPLPAPKELVLTYDSENTLSIDTLSLLPPVRWDQKLIPHWQIGEEAAQNQLNHFLVHGLPHYKLGRNFPAQNEVSRLSPYLHFGEISPHQIWHAVRATADDSNTDSFCSELGWREFSYHLLYHYPTLPHKNLHSKFDQFPWCDDDTALHRWQHGQTGYPIVDAGMRELWQTGYMHNRIRMIVGSFLVKNLLLDWRQGAQWFWDCLVDADLANNSASWQWVAGCGADAAPYFRIFNPITQGQKFDPTGEYTYRFVPELKKVPLKYLFNPWTAPAAMLQAAGIKMGTTYPFPIVDLQSSRAAALAAFSSLKKSD